jgi:SPP1 family predicted phage head-tail adaptor
MLRAGKLDRRVHVQEDELGAANDSGQETPRWATKFVAWAGVEPVSGGETWNDFQVQDDEDYVITIRYRDGVTSRDRVKMGARVFAVKRVVNPEEAGVELHLFCNSRE